MEEAAGKKGKSCAAGEKIRSTKTHFEKL